MPAAFLRMMGDRLLECDWLRDEHYVHETPAEGINRISAIDALMLKSGRRGDRSAQR